MEYRNTIDQRYSSDVSNRERDIPSFIEPRPPLILNPFMRPRPQKGTNLLELFEEDDSIEEEGPELVQVYLRLKPSNVPSSLYEVRGDQCLITSVDTATAGHGRRTQHNVCKMYSFSHIFGPDANQKEIFEHVVKGNLRKLPEGHSFTLLTYGASGSGKTYTLMGTVKAPGLVPRSLEYVFKVVEAAQMPLYRPGESRANKLSLAEQEYELQWVRNLRHLSAPLREKYRRMSSRLCSDMSRSTVDLSKRTKHYVWVSFVEIYNEAIYDLLVTTDRTAASKLRIREDPSGNVYVKGATQAFVRTGEEAYDILVAGKHNLQVHATGVHAQSSRSHCIFTITMLTETESGVRASHVRLCDLAGSERARRTHNTGARMQESRAINSSLHVLERCLHTLRRKQTSRQDLVPYRESKLTRLLGTGLSGTRGEAVSMVVTLNPAPEYAHETRHVLQLAAVARDIQVNNTIAESISTLESTQCSQETTVTTNAEVARLRAENERLHYELVQAESLNRKLMEDMAEQQQENAVTVKELVEEARDITQQYYKSQLRSLEERHEAEIAELREEYEAKLAKPVVAEQGTPSRALQNNVMQLMKQIAILEEQLNAERLARARMNEEVLHLRACIEERDEKASDNSQEDAIQVIDSESDDNDEEDDLCNDSLEPTFKKEDINRSRLLRRSSSNTRNTTLDNMDKTYDRDESSVAQDSKRDDTITEETGDDTYDANDTYNQSLDCPATVKKADVKDLEVKEQICDSKVDKHSVRETYFVNSNVSLSASEEKKDSIHNSDTGHFADVSVSLRDDDDLKDFSIIGDINVKPIKTIETQIDKFKKFTISTASNNNSLAQFEILEMEMNDLNKDEKSAFKYFDDGTVKKSISMSPRKKDKKPYFDNEQPSQRQISMVKDLINKQDALRSPSIVQDEIPENYKPTTINKIMRESFTVSNDVLPVVCKNKMLKKFQDSIDPFEEADSPGPNKDLLKNVEEARKSIAKVSLVDKEIVGNPEITADFERKVKSAKPEITEDIETKVKSAKSEITADIETKVKSAKPEITADIETKVKSAKSEITADIETKVKSAKPEITADIETKVKSAKSEITADIETKVKSAKSEITADIETKVKSAKSEITADIETKVKSAKPEITADIETKVKSAKSEITADIETKVKSAKPEITADIATKVKSAKPEITADIATKVKSAKPEITADIATKVKSAKLEITADIETKVKSAKPEITQDIETKVRSEIMQEAVKFGMKSEIMTDVVEKDVSETKPDEAAEDVANDLTKDLVDPVLEENKSTNKYVALLENEVCSDVNGKREMLTEVKQEQTTEENESKDIAHEIKSELPLEISSINDVTNSNQTIASDNTVDAFENIYKDISAPRATDFELLVSEKSLDTSDENQTDAVKVTIEKVNNIEEINDSKNNNKKKDDFKENHVGDINNRENKPEDDENTRKYNLRHKSQNTSKTDNNEISIEFTEKCAPRTAKKSLRLRRRNKVEEQIEEDVKLKDIVNLQKEFSDVTMGVPAPEKIVKDMPSPEKSESENLPPLMGVQSCPSKSVTRSRRKLFTPRAEPLEESPPAGDSLERVRVPRPSYHRPRTRRRLN